jgi:hypothetical protein
MFHHCPMACGYFCNTQEITRVLNNLVVKLKHFESAKNLEIWENCLIPKLSFEQEFIHLNERNIPEVIQNVPFARASERGSKWRRLEGSFDREYEWCFKQAWAECSVRCRGLNQTFHLVHVRVLKGMFENGINPFKSTRFLKQKIGLKTQFLALFHIPLSLRNFSQRLACILSSNLGCLFKEASKAKSNPGNSILNGRTPFH